MNASKITMLLTAAALFAAGGAFAAETSSHARADQLRRAREQVAARASGEKGLPRDRLNMESARLGGLIDDVESGKTVDPAEIDRALQRAGQVGR
jgi:hypothetical protein